VQLQVAWIGKTKEPAIQSLTDEYVRRLKRYTPLEAFAFASETAMLHALDRKSGRAAAPLVLLDLRGKQLSSEELARFIAHHQDSNPLPLTFAIGPADGFSDAARARASFVLSLGRMTLPHELARVVLLEQLYRAFSIIKGHPYHLGH
jgi:23S rRNA (pseudouridine1915-N3)-methyltransferase